MGVKVREKPKGSGEWWIFINHRGKRKSKKIGSRKLAMQVAEKVSAKLTLDQFDMGDPEDQKAPTFKDYSSVWLEDYIGPLRKLATYERYRDVLKRFVYPTLSNRPVDKISRADVRDLLLKVHKEGYSRSSVALVRDVLSGPMGYAVDEELIPANPVTGILKRLKLERDRSLKIEPLTSEEVGQLLSTCKDHFSPYYPFLLAGFRTGMRLGELLALEWSDIDWNSKFFRVNKSFKRGRVETPKNGKERHVDMSDQLAACLKALETQRKRESMRTGQRIELVFHKDGKHIAQNSIRNVYNRILRRAGIRKIRIHDMRHTFASLLLSNGESPVYVKEQLGHSSIQITVDIYGHLIPSSNRKAVNRLDSLHPSAPHTHPQNVEKP